jgi:hypothetical protein
MLGELQELSYQSGLQRGNRAPNNLVIRTGKFSFSRLV